MDCPISGEIVSSSTKARAVRRFVDKQIKSWVRNRRARYHVKFDREPGGHGIECQVQIWIDAEKGATPEQWLSHAFGSGTHQALIKALAHLTRIPGPLVRVAPKPDLRHAS